MILRVPFYYKEFHCIADACKDSCCIGWEIDIDEETARRDIEKFIKMLETAAKIGDTVN